MRYSIGDSVVITVTNNITGETSKARGVIVKIEDGMYLVYLIFNGYSLKVTESMITLYTDAPYVNNTEYIGNITKEDFLEIFNENFN